MNQNMPARQAARRIVSIFGPLTDMRINEILPDIEAACEETAAEAVRQKDAEIERLLAEIEELKADIATFIQAESGPGEGLIDTPLPSAPATGSAHQ
jgi:hypothetical protein